MAKSKKQPDVAKIPKEVLDKFIDSHIVAGDRDKIIKFGEHFLYSSGEFETYRVNLWMRESVSDNFCDKIYIGYTWFLEFDKGSKKLVDKTDRVKILKNH